MSLQPRPGGQQAVLCREEAEGWEEDSSHWGEGRKGRRLRGQGGRLCAQGSQAESQPLQVLGLPAFSQGQGGSVQELRLTGPDAP